MKFCILFPPMCQRTELSDVTILRCIYQTYIPAKNLSSKNVWLWLSWLYWLYWHFCPVPGAHVICSPDVFEFSLKLNVVEHLKLSELISSISGLHKLNISPKVFFSLSIQKYKYSRPYTCNTIGFNLFFMLIFPFFMPPKFSDQSLFSHFGQFQEHFFQNTV